ncbi:phenylalanine--tRNA ligase subunit beta [Candidatus Parcubacteria bacterium]|jgi:phenylalanyl-tRNA synthetase beta chain|nr:phenylalanine--tRNA ligase subunit beta [Candidatus Parcubacteria bacterium]
MYLSLNWVKKHLKLPNIDAKQLALDLTMSTVEVEGVMDQSESLKDIVAGKITELTKHPNADRLYVCQVDIGEKEEQIVCGGNNLKKGMTVALAKVGSKVKWHGQGELVTLEKTKIRGVESNGMIAASSEIGLGNLFPAESENEILDLSSMRPKVGQPLAEALKLNDIVIDIDNKSINHRPDLWGQYGMARELAAIYKTKLKEYKVAELESKKEIKLRVDVEDKENCYRYLGLAIHGVKVEESPWWLKVLLESVDIRPINNIVDVTNYIMYELGQPMHAFDAKQIADNHIVVKQAIKGDKFVTLDGEKRKLPEGALMIADSQRNVALAGIMGGQNSEISNDTTNIILESANFKAASVRRTSVALGLRSESSTRFEKSLDPVLAEMAIKKATEMILALNKEAYVASELVDVDNNPFKEINIKVPEALINERFGQIIPTAEIKDILKRLQFDIKYKAKTFDINVPSFRATKDISIPEDIVEEVARIYRYDNLESKLPIVSLKKPEIDIRLQESKEIKKFLACSQNYHEIYTYPFTDQIWAKRLGFDLGKHIKVANPFSPEQAYLNISLLPNLLKKAEENLRWYEEFNIFELERTFDKNSKGSYHTDPSKKKFLPKQDKYLVGVEVSKQSAQDTFLSVKGLLETMKDYWNIDWEIEEVELPFAELAFQVKQQQIILGNFGILNSDLFDSGDTKVNVGFWQLDFTATTKYINRARKFQALAKFPSIERDMALVVDQSIKWQDIENEVYKASSLIKLVELFDIYTGKNVDKGQKSIAFHIEFRSDERTLLAEDIDKLMGKIEDILSKKFKAVLR